MDRLIARAGHTHDWEKILWSAIKFTLRFCKFCRQSCSGNWMAYTSATKWSWRRFVTDAVKTKGSMVSASEPIGWYSESWIESQIEANPEFKWIRFRKCDPIPDQGLSRDFLRFRKSDRCSIRVWKWTLSRPILILLSGWIGRGLVRYQQVQQLTGTVVHVP